VSTRSTSHSSPPRGRPGRPRGHDPRRPERLEQILEAAAEAGELALAADPDEVAERLVAFIDGLDFETALGYSWTSPEPMHERLVGFAAQQLGAAAGVLREPAGARA
jgi:hypothetical protein